MRGKFIKETWVRGCKKHRWECQYCKENNAIECRFNLDPKKDNTFHKCKFCKNMILLEVENK
jgi:hypothetical protein